MNDSKKISKVNRSTTSKAKQPVDKYAALEKIGKLRDDGLLSEEEFQIEKQKILNS
jgi:hypothetical protein